MCQPFIQISYICMGHPIMCSMSFDVHRSLINSYRENKKHMDTKYTHWWHLRKRCVVCGCWVTSDSLQEVCTASWVTRLVAAWASAPQTVWNNSAPRPVELNICGVQERRRGMIGCARSTLVSASERQIKLRRLLHPRTRRLRCRSATRQAYKVVVAM